jgi:hypothetical protein
VKTLWRLLQIGRSVFLGDLERSPQVVCYRKQRLLRRSCVSVPVAFVVPGPGLRIIYIQLGKRGTLHLFFGPFGDRPRQDLVGTQFAGIPCGKAPLWFLFPHSSQLSISQSLVHLPFLALTQTRSICGRCFHRSC